MAQPTVIPDWIPDNTTNITDPGSLATYGYVNGIQPDASAHNWLFNAFSQWLNYQKEQDDKILRSDQTLTIASAGDVVTAQAIIDGLNEIDDDVTLLIRMTAPVTGSLLFENFKGNGVIQFTSATGTDSFTKAGTVLTFRDIQCQVVLDNSYLVNTSTGAVAIFDNCKNEVNIVSASFSNSSTGYVSIIKCPDVKMSSTNHIGIGGTAIEVKDNSCVYSFGLYVVTHTNDWRIERNCTVTEDTPNPASTGSRIIQDGGALRYDTTGGGVWGVLYN